MEVVVNKEPKPTVASDAEPKLGVNNHTVPISPPPTTTVAAAADSSPPRSSDEHETRKGQSSQISSPPSSAHSPPLSPLHLQSRPESPPADGSPGASSISSGHSSGTSHVSSLSDENLHQIPPETALALPSPAEVHGANRLVRDEPKIVVAEVDLGARDAFASGGDGGDRETAAAVASNGHNNHGNRRRKRPEPSIFRKLKVKNTANRVLLGFRILGFIFCLVSFSVMAADKNQGWAIDSFNRYKEFRYSMAVNVIGCAYSGLQAAELAYKLATGKRISGNHLRRYYVDFFLDQIIAYLLMSSSSSAATRVEDWQSNWGKDKFPSMASASVGLSFTAFVAMALSSLVSGYLLCTLRSST